MEVFDKNQRIFCLRRNKYEVPVSILIFGSLWIFISWRILVKIENYYISLSIIFILFSILIYLLVKEFQTKAGFYIVAEKEKISFLHLKTKKELFSTFINSIQTDTYIINYKGSSTYPAYLAIKLKVSGFKNISIRKKDPLARIIVEEKKLPVKQFVLTPHYIVDKDTWQKINKLFNAFISNP